jgi:beta-galactosidase
MTSYALGRKEMLAKPLLPCFNRAPIENDLGAALPSRWNLWRNPEFKVSSFKVSDDSGSSLIEVEYKPIGGKVPLSVFYEVRADGSVSVVERMGDAPDAPDLFRFGMEFAMPGTYGDIDFFGLGPWENYIDRNSACLLGRYRQKVADQYHMGYVRTQESGTHTGLRFFRILDGSGNGLEIASVADFSASALPYSIADLDVSAPEGDVWQTNANGQRGIPRHSLELVPSGLTHVHVDLVQMGVGSVNSWGAEPLDKYHVHPVAREFRFVMSPVVVM